MALTAKADSRISGKVLDNYEKPIKGVSVYINNTIDGETTDSLGVFSFTTSETGNQTIVAALTSYETTGLPIVITADVSGIVLRMRKNTQDLQSVTITAGSFGSGDRTKTVLSPIDVVTTAGSNGDVVKAMQMLPGTQQNGTDNGLLIRGGDVSEAAIIVDETVVQSAFVSGPPGLATRSRFSPFQFKGVSFSSGGYSAKYGQALSGVLDLNSNDMPDKSNINLGASIAGVYGSGTKRWKKCSFDIGGNYTNVAPLLAISSTSNGYNFYKVPTGAGGNARFVWEPNKDGILKATFSTTYNESGIDIPNPNFGNTDSGGRFFNSTDEKIKFITRDNYYLGTISYKQMFKNKYSLYTAASYSFDKQDNQFGTVGLKQNEYRTQYRIEGKRYFTSRLNLLVGGEVQSFGIGKATNYQNYFTQKDTSIKQNFDENQLAAYTEMEWTPVYWLALRPGVRYEHSTLLNVDKVAPRFSTAIKTGMNSQVSLAGGIFYQNANNNYYLAGLKPGMQSAIHYIANWQYSQDNRTFRLEGYYKNYQDLVREHSMYNPSTYRFFTDTMKVDNTGYGYAQGLELFWRDKKSFKNTDYWISYSYIDTKRLYENFITSATPRFVAQHNLSVVGKHFIDKWHANISATYSYASGYPYYDPTHANANGIYNATIDAANFLKDKTPDFHNTAVTAAWLHSFGKWFSVFYISVDNVLNTHNVFGYRYYKDNSGTYQKTAVYPGFYRTVFFGANFSLSQFSKDEL
jgi:hypothetical protein